MNSLCNYLNVMFNPISYIDPNRFSCDKKMLKTTHGRSIINNIIIEEYALSTNGFGLSTSTQFVINNWMNIKDIVFIIGCLVLRSEFIHRGEIIKIPKSAKYFITHNMIPLNIETSASDLLFDGSVESIYRAGYSFFMPFISTLPCQLKQRIVLFFSRTIDNVNSRNGISPVIINMVSRYVKKNPTGISSYNN